MFAIKQPDNTLYAPVVSEGPRLHGTRARAWMYLRTWQTKPEAELRKEGWDVVEVTIVVEKGQANAKP